METEEITAEFTQEQLAPAVQLKTTIRATVAAKTDLGRVRENNEDKFEFYVPEDPFPPCFARSNLPSM